MRWIVLNEFIYMCYTSVQRKYSVLFDTEVHVLEGEKKRREITNYRSSEQEWESTTNPWGIEEGRVHVNGRVNGNGPGVTDLENKFLTRFHRSIRSVIIIEDRHFKCVNC